MNRLLTLEHVMSRARVHGIKAERYDLANPPTVSLQPCPNCNDGYDALAVSREYGIDLICYGCQDPVAITEALLAEPAKPLPSDAAGWEPQNLLEIDSRPPEPPTVGGLFYPGRRHVVSGEYECGKSWLLLCVAAVEVESDHGVVWVDADDMGAAAVLERLRQLGVPDERIAKWFAYIRPDTALTDPTWDSLRGWIEDRAARLVVFDAFNPVLSIHGLDPGKTPDVERFYKTVVDRFKSAGCAAVLLDHLVKNPDTSKRYSYGSERKATGADVHLGLTVIAAFGRGKTGRAKITVHKDRPGFLQRPNAGVLTVESSPESGAVSWRISEDTSTSDSGEFRPTGLMEKVSRYLEVFTTEAKTRAAVEEAVKGKATWTRLAIDTLVREGYAAEEKGDRGARLVRIVRAFREDEMEDE